MWNPSKSLGTWLLLYSLSLACCGSAGADDVKVQAQAGHKIKVTVEPVKPSLGERMAAWRAGRKAPMVVMVPAAVAAGTVTIPADLAAPVGSTVPTVPRPVVITVTK